ncbi:hypothetical protein GCM10009719_10580 [Nocardioides kribbensis]
MHVRSQCVAPAGRGGDGSCALGACDSASSPASDVVKEAESVSDSPTPAPDKAEKSVGSSAERLCADAAPDDAKLLGAWPTTVHVVRQRRGGPAPAPGGSRPPHPWAGLDGSQPAAWCTFSLDGSYAVSAATGDGPLIDFMVTETPPGKYPDGPKIP